MRKAIVIALGALGLALGSFACSKDKTAVDTTTTHGASATSRLTAEDVRAALLDKRPSATDQINALVITNDDGIVTLRGHVEDESTHDDLVNRVRAMSAVRGVRDEITVAPRFLQSRNPPASPTYSAGTTTTTGADIGTSSSHDQSDVQSGRTGEGANANPVQPQKEPPKKP